MSNEEILTESIKEAITQMHEEWNVHFNSDKPFDYGVALGIRKALGILLYAFDKSGDDKIHEDTEIHKHLQEMDELSISKFEKDK